MIPIKVRIKFEKRDIWIGVYWDYVSLVRLDFYVCVVPCFPVLIHINLHERLSRRFWRERVGKGGTV
jgi:hypothetical protein